MPGTDDSKRPGARIELGSMVYFGEPLRVRHPIDGGWVAIAEVVAQRGRPAISSLTILPEDGLPPGGLQSRKLRTIKLDQIHRDVTLQIAEMLKSEQPHLVVTASSIGFSFGDRLPPPYRAPGKRSHPDRFLAEVAAAYIALFEAGVAHPTARLAADRKVKPTYIRDLLGKARRRGLLLSAGQGKAGGALTDHALRLLREDEREGGGEKPEI